jgi:hypothetical protein
MGDLRADAGTRKKREGRHAGSTACTTACGTEREGWIAADATIGVIKRWQGNSTRKEHDL